MNAIRSKANPIISPKDIKPLNENFKIDGVFNAGATIYNDEVILILRVAQSIKSEDQDIIKIPYYEDNQLKIRELHKINDSDKYDFSDSRHPYYKGTKTVACLTSISHLQLARSKDGINFKIDEEIFMQPTNKYEEWGVEDPRVVLIENEYYINYTGCSKLGAMSLLAKTKDFKEVERLGVIFAPENKDVCLFNEKINGLYYAYHRPVPKAFGNPDIYLASSTDILRFGDHHHVLGVDNTSPWENSRIGGGAPSIKTKAGWLHIYHAANEKNCYCIGAFLTSLDNPAIITHRLKEPILRPEEKYELEGFFGNVVFTCGTVTLDEDLYIYYGAADECIGVATIKLNNLLEELLNT